MKYGPEDRICLPVPLYHCFAMVVGNLAALAYGSTLIYPSEGFDPVATLEAIERHKATTLYGVPTMFVSVLETLS